MQNKTFESILEEIDINQEELDKLNLNKKIFLSKLFNIIVPYKRIILKSIENTIKFSPKTKKIKLEDEIISLKKELLEIVNKEHDGKYTELFESFIKKEELIVDTIEKNDATILFESMDLITPYQIINIISILPTILLLLNQGKYNKEYNIFAKEASKFDDMSKELKQKHNIKHEFQKDVPILLELAETVTEIISFIKYNKILSISKILFSIYNGKKLNEDKEDSKKVFEYFKTLKKIKND